MIRLNMILLTWQQTIITTETDIVKCVLIFGTGWNSNFLNRKATRSLSFIQCGTGYLSYSDQLVVYYLPGHRCIWTVRSSVCLRENMDSFFLHDNIRSRYYPYIVNQGHGKQGNQSKSNLAPTNRNKYHITPCNLMGLLPKWIVIKMSQITL